MARWPRRRAEDPSPAPMPDWTAREEQPQPRRTSVTDPRLRQFALTGGRARPAEELPLEVPVLANPGWRAPSTTLPEHFEIMRRCTTPQTLADLSSALSTPVGAVRVFVLDLAEAGALTVHWSGPPEVAPHTDVHLLQEALRGIGSL